MRDDTIPSRPPLFKGRSRKRKDRNFDNYNNYLELNVFDDYETRGVPTVYGTIQEKAAINFYANAKGVSTNYNYNNVVIKIKIHCIYQENAAWAQSGKLETKTFDTTLTLKLNVAGTGSVTGTCPASSADRCIHDVVSFDYTIVDIQGTVAPA